MADRLVAAIRGKAYMDSGTNTLAREVDALVRGDAQSEITPDIVAHRWKIGLTTAAKTHQVTTQLGVRTLKHPAQRRFCTAMPHLRYPRLKGTY